MCVATPTVYRPRTESSAISLAIRPSAGELLASLTMLRSADRLSDLILAKTRVPGNRSLIVPRGIVLGITLLPESALVCTGERSSKPGNRAVVTEEYSCKAPWAGIGGNVIAGRRPLLAQRELSHQRPMNALEKGIEPIQGNMEPPAVHQIRWQP